MEFFVVGITTKKKYFILSIMSIILMIIIFEIDVYDSTGWLAVIVNFILQTVRSIFLTLTITSQFLFYLFIGSVIKIYHLVFIINFLILMIISLFFMIVLFNLMNIWVIIVFIVAILIIWSVLIIMFYLSTIFTTTILFDVLILSMFFLSLSVKKLIIIKIQLYPA